MQLRLDGCQNNICWMREAKMKFKWRYAGLVLLTIKLIPDNVWIQCKQESERLWEDGRQKNINIVKNTEQNTDIYY